MPSQSFITTCFVPPRRYRRSITRTHIFCLLPRHALHRAKLPTGVPHMIDLLRSLQTDGYRCSELRARNLVLTSVNPLTDNLWPKKQNKTMMQQGCKVFVCAITEKGKRKKGSIHVGLNWHRVAFDGCMLCEFAECIVLPVARDFSSTGLFA